MLFIANKLINDLDIENEHGHKVKLYSDFKALFKRFNSYRLITNRMIGVTNSELHKSGQHYTKAAV